MSKQVVWLDEGSPVELPKAHKKVRIGDKMIVNGESHSVFYIEELTDGTRNIRLEQDQ